MSNAIIRAAFETRLVTWAAEQSPPVPLAFQNRKFAKPVAPSRYAEAYLLPGRTVSLTLDGVHRRYVGIFQLSLFLPDQVGSGAGEALLPGLDALFPTTAPLSRAGMLVWITEPMSAAPALPADDGRFMLPVSCRYRADV